MSNKIRLGYQARVVSLQSPSCGQMSLSVEQHHAFSDSTFPAAGLSAFWRTFIQACQLMNNLWASNRLRLFWQIQPDFPDEIWNKAIQRSLPSFGLKEAPEDIGSLLEFTLGEPYLVQNIINLGMTFL